MYFFNDPTVQPLRHRRVERIRLRSRGGLSQVFARSCLFLVSPKWPRYLLSYA
jgi:hypothetical protein